MFGFRNEWHCCVSAVSSRNRAKFGSEYVPGLLREIEIPTEVFGGVNDQWYRWVVDADIVGGDRGCARLTGFLDRYSDCGEVQACHFRTVRRSVGHWE